MLEAWRARLTERRVLATSRAIEAGEMFLRPVILRHSAVWFSGTSRGSQHCRSPVLWLLVRVACRAMGCGACCAGGLSAADSPPGLQAVQVAEVILLLLLLSSLPLVLSSFSSRGRWHRALLIHVRGCCTGLLYLVQVCEAASVGISCKGALGMHKAPQMAARANLGVALQPRTSAGPWRPRRGRLTGPQRTVTTPPVCR